MARPATFYRILPLERIYAEREGDMALRLYLLGEDSTRLPLGSFTSSSPHPREQFLEALDSLLASGRMPGVDPISARRVPQAIALANPATGWVSVGALPATAAYAPTSLCTQDYPDLALPAFGALASLLGADDPRSLDLLQALALEAGDTTSLAELSLRLEATQVASSTGKALVIASTKGLIMAEAREPELAIILSQLAS